jgi:hypothetical protein
MPSAPQSNSNDPAFDTFCNLRLLAKAWEQQDASGLADSALLLSEGERVLLRQRKSLVATHLLEIAVYAAAATGDKDTLSRLAHEAERREDAKLSELVKTAPDLLATPNKPPAAPVDNAPHSARSHGAAVHRATLRHIFVIRLCGDKESLDSLKQSIAEHPDMTAEQKEHAIKRIADHSLTVDHSNPALRPTLRFLEELVTGLRSEP